MTVVATGDFKQQVANMEKLSMQKQEETPAAEAPKKQTREEFMAACMKDGKTMEQCAAEWDAKQKPATATPATPGESKSLNLTDRILNVVTEVMEKKLALFEKKIDDKIDGILKSKEVEVERALRKGFGLEEDPVVHMSDLISYGRKLGLQKAEPAKRTPGKEETGPGSAEEHPVDALFKAFELKEA